MTASNARMMCYTFVSLFVCAQYICVRSLHDQQMKCMDVYDSLNNAFSYSTSAVDFFPELVAQALFSNTLGTRQTVSAHPQSACGNVVDVN